MQLFFAIAWGRDWREGREWDSGFISGGFMSRGDGQWREKEVAACKLPAT